MPVTAEKASLKPIDWLLEPADPGARYLALRDLVKAGGKELAEAKKAAQQVGHFTRPAHTQPGRCLERLDNVFIPGIFRGI
ncbi:MAG: hypothetical protein WC370_04595 [Dehalococcoidales bacterium]|jgi:hypothetical protein